ncbi:serine/threonine-protein kinase GL21140 [Daktulosphaira vitifoliae]|uniref:serine/threonine-protein kinase GL21140 n=1 Tax=Daktulosphaira vitifoliae TaxID=58002 RepID=UPI0021A98C4C|nr:serine/threonine-protein kinase GL21140 [Daktulosphaira vitifoliae]
MQAVALRTPRTISGEECSPRQKSDVGKAARKAKRVRFLVNGDRFCKGVVVAVTNERYRSFDSLLAELSSTLSDNKHLPSGVRTLFSIDGRKISQLDDLEDGKFYICSGGNNTILKKMDYAALNNVKSSRSLTKLQVNQSIMSSPSKQQSQLNIRPKIIFVVRSGTRPRKIIRMLLNKRNSPSFEHVLSLITDSIKLDTGAVRKVFVSSGNQITLLKQFFESDDLFFVYGSERISQDDLKLDFEEMKIVQSHKRGLRKPANELKNGTHCMDESGRRVPRLPNTTKANRNIAGSIPSKVLNRYAVGDRLGDGNFAVVYRCFDKRNNSEYALKVIKKIEAPQMSQMIENELSILKTVSHPNIINLISDLVTLTDVYLITELVNGGDLFEAIARCTDFSERDTRLMTRNLASALAYLHSMDIVHRDVKPENLLVEFDERGHVLHLKLADFGLSQKVTEPLYMVCGTPTYVAPEILTQEGYGVKIDVWAAGVILYILLCGFPPFVSENNSQEELFDDILSGTYGFPEPYWDDVSDEAKDLVCSMLQSNPCLRFSAEDVLDHPWCDEYEL